MQKRHLVWSCLGVGIIGVAAAGLATNDDDLDVDASGQTAEALPCESLRAAMVEGGLDDDALAALNWVVVERPDFTFAEKLTEETRATSAAMAASLLPEEWHEFYRNLEIFEVHREDGQVVALVEGATVDNIEALRTPALVLGVPEAPSSGEAQLALVVLNGLDARDLGVCPEHRSVVQETLNQASVRLNGTGAPANIAAALNALELDSSLSEPPELTEPPPYAGPRWSDMRPDERSFIDHMGALGAEPEAASRLATTHITFEISGDSANLAGVICFRTPSAWAGCFEPGIVASEAFKGYPINTFAGEPVDIVLLPETANFTDPTAYLGTFSPSDQPQGTVDVAIRGSFDDLAAAAERIGTDEARRAAPVLSVEVTPDEAG